MSQPTLEDLREHADALKAKFGKDASIAYSNVSQTQLSIARHYGGCKIQGHQFFYNAADDSLIREDVGIWLENKMRTSKKGK